MNFLYFSYFLSYVHVNSQTTQLAPGPNFKFLDLGFKDGPRDWANNKQSAYTKNIWKSYGSFGHSQASFINEQEIRVKYPKGTYSSPNTGGYLFMADPLPASDSMELHYQIYVPKDFIWVKGGKLPGLYAGEKRSGGNTRDLGIAGSSFRLMWRRNGDMEVYCYAPIKNGTGIIESVNSPGVNSLMLGYSRLKANQWNDILLYVKMNDPNTENGVIRLSVNGETHEIRNLRLRIDPNLKLKGIFYEMFFGGGSPGFATPIDQYMNFRNHKVSNLMETASTTASTTVSTTVSTTTPTTVSTTASTTVSTTVSTTTASTTVSTTTASTTASTTVNTTTPTTVSTTTASTASTTATTTSTASTTASTTVSTTTTTNCK